MHPSKIIKKLLFGLRAGVFLFPLMVNAADEPAPFVIATGITAESTLDTLEFVLKNPEIATLENIKRATAILRERLISNPDILDGISTQIIVNHPALFNRQLLNKLFEYLKNGAKDRSASNAIVAIAVNAGNRRLTEAILSGIASAFDDERSAWWAADITSRIAGKKPCIITDSITNRLFGLMEAESSWIVASAAICTIALNTTDEIVQSDILTKAIAALDRRESARQAAYIIFRISETKSQLISREAADRLFSVIQNNEAPHYDGVDFSVLTYTRDRGPALYAADALAALASLTGKDRLSRDIVSRAASGLDDKNWARLASYILVKISEAKPHRITPAHLAKLFSLTEGNGCTSWASDALAAMVSLTKDEPTAVYITSKAAGALDEKGSACWAVRMLAAGGERWNYLVNGRIVGKLLTLLGDKDAAPYAAKALTQTAILTKDRKLARNIITEMLRDMDPKDPQMGAARNLLEIARIRPQLLRPQVGKLFDLLQIDAIKKEISLSLYFALLSADTEIRARIDRFIEENLSHQSMDEGLHNALLHFAQTVSSELDRLHQIDISNSEMKKMITNLPDTLLYLVLAQGIEGYVTTFKEVHRAFKQRNPYGLNVLDEHNDNDSLWRKFKRVDPHSHFFGDLLYAYAAKGHLASIIPADTILKQDMVDAAIDFVENARDAEEVKGKGTLMADAVTLFLGHPQTGKYARRRLLDSYRANTVNLPKKVMFEALIFRNRDKLESWLNRTERQSIIGSGHYVDFTAIPAALNKKSQKMFVYFSASQKGYLTRMIDYYTGSDELFVGDQTEPHPHSGRIRGFKIDRERSTRGISGGATTDMALAEVGDVKVVLAKKSANRNMITFILSNSMDELETAIDDTSYTAYGFAGHSGENRIFREIVGDRLGPQNRPAWIYDGSCGSARRVTHVVKNAHLFLFGNLVTGQGQVNQIQIYYIAHYLAEGTFTTWHQLRWQMINEHTGYTRKLFYPGDPADNVLKNFILNMERLSKR